MIFDVTARQYGNAVQYTVEADGIKEALGKAITEADEIFEVKLGDNHPTVSVKQAKEPKEGA
jgi:hypothetical protein